MKKAIIRCFWGLHDEDIDFPLEMSKYSFYNRRIHRKKYTTMSLDIDRTWHYIDREIHSSFQFDYITCLFGARYLKAFMTLDKHIKMIDSRPYVHHPYYNSEWHIFDAINCVMNSCDYDEIVFLGWEFKLIKTLDVNNMWNILSQKESIQCCLQQFKNPLLDHRIQNKTEKKNPNSFSPHPGFIYLRNKSYLPDIMKLKSVCNVRQGLAKGIDNVTNGWVGLEKYMELYEPLCAKVRKQPLLYRACKKDVFFLHDPILRKDVDITRRVEATSSNLSGHKNNNNNKHRYSIQQLVEYLEGDEINAVSIGDAYQHDVELFCSDSKISKIYIVSKLDMRDQANCQEKIEYIGHPIERASEKFEDGSLDVIYLNKFGNYEEIKQDLRTWLPKLKNNGYMCGCGFDPRRITSDGGMVTAIREVLGLPSRVFMDRSWVIKL